MYMAIPPTTAEQLTRSPAVVKKNIITKNPYLFYISTSIAFGALVIVLSLYLSPNSWNDFYNSRPLRGEMGFGRFLIRGTRFVEGEVSA
jgi:hypothetical protein